MLPIMVKSIGDTALACYVQMKSAVIMTNLPCESILLLLLLLLINDNFGSECATFELYYMRVILINNMLNHIGIDDPGL